MIKPEEIHQVAPAGIPQMLNRLLFVPACQEHFCAELMEKTIHAHRTGGAFALHLQKGHGIGGELSGGSRFQDEQYPRL